MEPHARDIDESAMRRYMRRHDRDAHSHTAPPWPLSGRGGRARLIVTCGRGSRGAFLPKFDAVSGFPGGTCCGED
jgi:hypothetical protein